MIKKNMCCRQVAIAKMVQFLGARRASLRCAVCLTHGRSGNMWVVYNVSLNMRFVYNCRVHCVKFIHAAAEKHNNFNSFHNIYFAKTA